MGKILLRGLPAVEVSCLESLFAIPGYQPYLKTIFEGRKLKPPTIGSLKILETIIDSIVLGTSNRKYYAANSQEAPEIETLQANALSVFHNHFQRSIWTFSVINSSPKFSKDDHKANFKKMDLNSYAASLQALFKERNGLGLRSEMKASAAVLQSMATDVSSSIKNDMRKMDPSTVFAKRFMDKENPLDMYLRKMDISAFTMAIKSIQVELLLCNKSGGKEWIQVDSTAKGKVDLMQYAVSKGKRFIIPIYGYANRAGLNDVYFELKNGKPIAELCIPRKNYGLPHSIHQYGFVLGDGTHRGEHLCLPVSRKLYFQRYG